IITHVRVIALKNNHMDDRDETLFVFTHNASTQGDFDECIKKCENGSGLGEGSCMSDCGAVTNHDEVCETACGGNNGGLFPL
ncbi:unnamed protein product, partial [Schistosoma curassoni]